MKIIIITIFPDMFAAIRDYGVLGRAINKGLLDVSCINPRDFTTDNYQKIDDRPYGGGPGMVMLAEPLAKSIEAAKEQLNKQCVDDIKTVYLSPQGQVFNQAIAENNASTQNSGYILLAGRYEGVDERLLNQYVDEEWSIGDFVLSGGELAAMVVIDSIARLLPGALGHELSADQDSFSDSLLDCPHYTRPEEYNGESVPAVLLSGNHAHIARWRRQQSLGRTYLRRPDLLEITELSAEDKVLLQDFLDNCQ